MMKLVVIALAILLGFATAGRNDGPIDTLGNTAGQVTSTLGNVVGDILGFGKRITSIPWIDLNYYFDLVHGMKRIPGSDLCTCPYVYKGQYPKVQSGGLIGGVVDIAGSLTQPLDATLSVVADAVV